MQALQEHIRTQLEALKDEKNRLFVAKLIPNIPPETILGIKTPVLRAFAKNFSKDPRASEYLKISNHYYLEEKAIHAFLIEKGKDIEQTLALCEEFFVQIDNRATCDSLHPPVFKQNPELVYTKIKVWMESSHAYTLRFALGMLMSFYLDEEFKPEMLELVAQVKNEEYYVKMMQARYFATALAKQPNATLPLIMSKRLTPRVQNKSIQKARESRRISPEMKEYLQNLKVKL